MKYYANLGSRAVALNEPHSAYSKIILSRKTFSEVLGTWMSWNNKSKLDKNYLTLLSGCVTIDTEIHRLIFEKTIWFCSQFSIFSYGWSLPWHLIRYARFSLILTIWFNQFWWHFMMNKELINYSSFKYDFHKIVIRYKVDNWIIIFHFLGTCKYSEIESLIRTKFNNNHKTFELTEATRN